MRVRYRLLSIPLGLALGAGLALALGWMPIGRPVLVSRTAVLAPRSPAGESEGIRPAIIPPRVTPIEHEVLPAAQLDFVVPRMAFERGLVEDGKWTPTQWGDPWYVPAERQADARIESAGTVSGTAASAPASLGPTQPEGLTYAGLDGATSGEPPHPFSPLSEMRRKKPTAPAEPFVAAPEPGDTRPWYVYPNGDGPNFAPDWRRDLSSGQKELPADREHAEHVGAGDGKPRNGKP